MIFSLEQCFSNFGETISNNDLKASHYRCNTYLADKTRMTSIGDVILTYVAVQPVAQEQVTVIQRQQNVRD